MYRDRNSEKKNGVETGEKKGQEKGRERAEEKRKRQSFQQENSRRDSSGGGNWINVRTETDFRRREHPSVSTFRVFEKRKEQPATLCRRVGRVFPLGAASPAATDRCVSFAVCR